VGAWKSRYLPAGVYGYARERSRRVTVVERGPVTVTLGVVRLSDLLGLPLVKTHRIFDLMIEERQFEWVDGTKSVRSVDDLKHQHGHALRYLELG
jgi:hypothetical protein